MQDFDYIIVGGGSAGCVLAARLSEDPAVRVLLLEAGGRDNHPLIHVPIGIGPMYDRNMFDWGYSSEPEPQANGRRIPIMRGKVLGGCSSINVMTFTRGHSGDFNRWAQKGALGWSAAEVQPYFKRSESWQGGEDAWRGGSGPVGVTFGDSGDPLTEAWLASAQTAGEPITADYNGRDQEGFGRGQYSIHNGRRSSASVAYLRPARRRRNLTVLTRAHAARVVVEGRAARGVEYIRSGARHFVRAEREVILCGGAINSPQLLMLSGVGPADHLRDHGIEVVADLPVGRNLQDHPVVTMRWTRPHGGPFRELMRADRMAMNLVRGYLFGTGPATVVPGGLHAFIKTRPELDVPDVEFMFRHTPDGAHLWMPLLRPPYRDGFAVRPVVLHPDSRGEIRLRSADPFEPVRISLNLFTARRDLVTLREATKRVREIASQRPLDPFRGEELAPGPAVTSDSAIEDWIRSVVHTALHPAGTCAMGIGPESVLDPQLRVRGVERLRVVDASAMPDLPTAHLNACVMMMAEKAADLIRGREMPALDARHLH